jgi:small-conductance mechanosensitive channel
MIHLYIKMTVLPFTAHPNSLVHFFPKDAKSISIFIKTKDNLSKVKSDSLARNIEKAFNKYHFDEVHFVGRIVAQDVYLKNLEKEFVYFLAISFVLVILISLGYPLGRFTVSLFL